MNANFSPKLKPLLFPIMLDSLGIFFINFLIPIVAHQNFHANGWEMGLLFSLQAIGTGVAALLFSKRVNKWANRSTLALIGCAFKALAYGGLYLAIISENYQMMVVATFALGFGSGMFWLVWQTCFAQLSEFGNRAETLGEASKQMGTGVMFGSIFAFTLMNIAEDNYMPARISYAVILGFSVASALASFLSFRAISAMSPEDMVKQVAESVPMRLSTVAIFLFGLVFIGQLSGSLVAPFLEVYLLDHLNITSIGELSIAYIPGGIVSLMVAPKLGKYADRMNPAYFLCLAGLIGATTTWVMLQVTELWQISLLFIVDASVIMSSALVLSKLISEVAGENKGSAFGLQGFISNFGAIGGPLVGGFFWQLNGATGPLIFSIFTETFLAVCCILVLLPALKRNNHYASLIQQPSSN